MNIDWDSILAAIIANSTVVLIFGLLLPYWMSYHRTPQAVLLKPKSHSGPYIRSEKKDGVRSFTARLVLSNVGATKLSPEIYWHMYVPGHITIAVPEGVTANQADGFLHVAGSINNHVYPQRSAELGFDLTGTLPQKEGKDDTIYYMISTEFGIYPKQLRFINADTFLTKNRYYYGEIRII